MSRAACSNSFEHHHNWAALIVFVLAFGESLAFVSLIPPSRAMLVSIGTVICR